MTNKKMNTKERIIKEAANLFYLQGYKKTTMRSLAASVGIKHPSLFSFFENKSAILMELMTRYYDGVQKYTDEICEENNDLKGHNPFLVFYAVHFLLLYNDQRFLNLYTSFYAEEKDVMDKLVEQLNHMDEYKLKVIEENRENKFAFLDLQLLCLIAMMLVGQMGERKINSQEATKYYISKIFDMTPHLFEMTCKDTLNLYENNWSYIEEKIKSVDIYNDLLLSKF